MKLVDSILEALKQKFKKGDKVKTNDGHVGKITKSKEERGRMGPETVYWVSGVEDPYQEDELTKQK